MHYAVSGCCESWKELMRLNWLNWIMCLYSIL